MKFAHLIAWPDYRKPTQPFDELKVGDKLWSTLTNKDTVQVIGDLETIKESLKDVGHGKSAKWHLDNIMKELGKTDANILTESKDSPKGKYSTLTKEKIPTELNKLVDGIKDENLKSAIGKWVNDKLKTMENC